MGEFTADFEYEALISQDQDAARSIEQSKQNLSVIYQSFTKTVRNYSIFEVIDVFDSVERLLCERNQNLHLNPLYRVKRDVVLAQFFTVSDVTINADTIRAAINCINQEMARRGRAFMVDRE